MAHRATLCATDCATQNTAEEEAEPDSQGSKKSTNLVPYSSVLCY